MQYFQSSKRMLIISNDSFIVGILTGYCVANHFTLKNISFSKAMNLSELSSRFKLIIIDLRELTLEQSETYLEQLKQIRNQYSIPVCAIHNRHGRPLCRMQPWVDYYQDDIFVERLDNYINKYVIHIRGEIPERRKHNRRLGSDRRKVLNIIKSFSPKLVNGKNGLIHKDIDNDLLGIFEIDKNCQAVYMKGKDLGLTGKEYKLFNLLAKFSERVCPTESIIRHLWPNRERANKSDLYQYMHLLRRKVEQSPDNPRWILTVKGVGYKLHI